MVIAIALPFTAAIKKLQHLQYNSDDIYLSAATSKELHHKWKSEYNICIYTMQQKQIPSHNPFKHPILQYVLLNM